MKAVAFLLLLLLETHSAHTYENVALDGKATQSTTYLNPACNAIDGSCTQTDEETDPWWRVDLLHPYVVTSIAITNRGDCCQERLNGATVHVGNSAANPIVGTIGNTH
ncbi:fucolectin-like isoform 2-T2 [Spinachia spinachia]